MVQLRDRLVDYIVNSVLYKLAAPGSECACKCEPQLSCPEPKALGLSLLGLTILVGFLCGLVLGILTAGGQVASANKVSLPLGKRQSAVRPIEDTAREQIEFVRQRRSAE